MEGQPAQIRRYRPDDIDVLFHICLRTADNGRDAVALFHDPELPGHVYVAPHVTFEPALAFVAEDALGVGGYIVAALDSRAFEQRLEREWWPALRARYPGPSPDRADQVSLPEQFALHDIHHPFGAPPQVIGRYPSHLHINLLPRMQGHGAGRELISTLLTRIRTLGSAGLHLLVGHSNERAIGFYRHLGFIELPATGVHIFVMELAAGKASGSTQRKRG